jgi:hypothetical protein
MKKYTTITVEEVVDKLDKLYCNNCGKECDFEKEQVVEVKVKWGYNSKKDLEIHEFELCEDCYDDIVADFTMPVTVKADELMLDISEFE